MNEIDFSFADMIAGYVETVDPGASFLARTSDGRRFQIELTEATSANPSPTPRHRSLRTR